MKKIKVLHIIKSLGRGGAEMLLAETVRMHDQEQFEFHVLYFLPWKDQLVSEIKNAGGVISCIPASNNLGIIFQYRKIIAYCKKNNIDLIHAHLPWAGIVARLVGRISKIPVLYTEHNKQERYHIGTRMINLATMRWLTGLIAVSDDVAQSVRKHKPHLQVPVHVVLNGVDLVKFFRGAIPSTVREDLKISKDATVIGTIAVFRAQKRLDVWLDCAAAILRKSPHTQFLIVGDGPLKGELLKKATDNHLAANVHFAGLQQEVRPFLEAMDIYMMSSEFEGLPIALLEAMSMGLPIVATSAGGIGEVVRHQTEGLICRVEDHNQLVPYAESLIVDDAMRSSMGANARKRIELKFSMEVMVAALEKLYRQTMQRHVY